MSDYKRLTERCGKFPVIKETSTKWDAIDRLAELEDDLESGKMIRLPCKVGDTVYYISMIWNWELQFIGEIYEANVSGFYFGDGCIQIEDDVVYDYHNYGEDVFLTRAEAEQKLKELKG